MSRTTTLLRASVVAAAAVALLAGCVGPVAPQTPVETPKPEPDLGTIGGGESPVPIETGAPLEPQQPDTAGYYAVLDDLDVVTVTVPDDWTEVDGAPFTTDAGQEWASITVAPDVQGYLDSWEVSGLEIAATAVQGVTDDQLLALLTDITGIYDSCTTAVQEAKPYADGYFAGYESAYEGCGTSGTSAFALTVASDAGDQALFLRAQITGDDDPNEVYLQVVQSFDTKVGRTAGRAD